ncbi:UNVERIFIED_CONTAM: hypothetical protein HDU68_008041 [Siphonaria sp. JEL0065]|nr:hypothetical protein HDU68_008041 [Siphonaria sp. JEL0065]
MALQPTAEILSFWSTQGKVTEPGEKGSAAIDALDSSIPALREAASKLIFHYRANSDAKFIQENVPLERRSEIDTRTASAMFDILLDRQPGLQSPRAPVNRIVGCCRDATVLFVSMARQKGIPARCRSGFAAYLIPGVFMDHVIAEVWNVESQSWIIVDPQMPSEWKPQCNGVPVDWNNLTPDQFITAPRAWLGLKNGSLPIENLLKFCVGPDLNIPSLEGWPQIAHNVIQDLAMLNKQEMLLWDSWDDLEFRGESMDIRELSEKDNGVIDEVSEAIVDVDKDSGVSFRVLAGRDGLKVTNVVFSMNVLSGVPRHVDVSHLLG